MAKIYSIDGSVKGETKLPKAFKTSYRPDVIKKAVLSEQSSARQTYGADVLAGKRTSAHYHGRRRTRTTMMGRGIARMARIHGKVGYLAFRARFVPQAVKGRGAHPPKIEKAWERLMNKKELMLALRSALSAATNKLLVVGRGHTFEGEVPIILEDKFETLGKSRELEKILDKIGLENEIERCKERKAGSGKGKRRGRNSREKKGMLFIVSKECALLKAAENLPGAEAVTVKDITMEQLAPGSQAGRLLLITEPALVEIEKML
jgi:large subunit ribosomal protein L4e